MRFVRYQQEADEPRYGWVFEDNIGPIEGLPYGEYRRLEAVIPIKSVKLLAPVIPGKIICVGRNYEDHAREQGVEVSEIPILFIKPTSCVIGPGAPIVYPPQSHLVEHEGELAVVIGKRGRWILPENAGQHILGYTIANDVTARDLQRRDGQWTRGKSFDSFCPLGPWIETEIDPVDVLITTKVNNEMRQMASSREMVFTIQQLMAFISSIMTLEPGDVILTGTPAGTGPIQPGDLIEINIEGIGTLHNPVVQETHSLV